MAKYVAQRIRFQNGERHSVLQVPYGLPVHEVTLYLDRYRKKGRAANTIHFVCSALALLYRELDSAKVNLLDRLANGRFLSIPELDRLVSATQHRVQDLDEDDGEGGKSNVININRIVLRRSRKPAELRSVDVQTHASRLRYLADYLAFISNYMGEGLPGTCRRDLEIETERALTAFREHIPAVSKRAKLGARMGLSMEEQARVVAAVHPDSLSNPWKRGIVRRRNWLIIVLLLATGTGEEMLDQIGLVHLNGRVYDPLTGKFLSADPNVTDPTNGQNYNRYSYVLNNPTNLTDPTGFDWRAIQLMMGWGSSAESNNDDRNRPTSNEGSQGSNGATGQHTNSSGSSSNSSKDGGGPPPDTNSANTAPATSRPDNCQSLGCINQSTGEATPIVHHTGNIVQDVTMDEASKAASGVWNAGRAIWNGIKEVTMLGIGGVAEGGGATVAQGELNFGRKLDFLFNKGIDQSNAYNAARAAGNAERIGIADNPLNRTEVTRLFNNAYRDSSTIVPSSVPGRTMREFFLPGVTGTGSKIQFVEEAGRVITIISK